MAGRKADLLLTDPPYNMAYEGAGNSKDRSRKILNDNMPEDEFETFLTTFYVCAEQAMKDGATAYVFYKEMGHGTFMRAMNTGRPDIQTRSHLEKRPTWCWAVQNTKTYTNRS